jgi:hypothetical protein
MRRPRITRFGGVAALLVLVSCTELAEVELGQGEAGATCAQVSDCRAGLLCTDDVCTPIEGAEPASARGQACGASAPCPSGLCCGSQAVCRPVEASFAAGMCGGSVGSGCGFTADCAPGLVCTSAGECAAPDGEGTGGLGASCAELSDCRRPLVCGLAKTCERLPFFAGVSCTRSEEEVGAFRMYFEVPGSAPLDEFFRHPFPSDVRRGDDGHPILDGYPSPGEVLGIDFTRLYVDAIEQDTDGFALTAPVFTQWSDALDPRTLSINTATATVYLVDVATDTRVPLQLGLKTERGQLTCANTVAVAPLDGVALAPRTTYALVFEAGIRSRRGEAPIQDAALAALLAEATPSAPELARAHARYAPLRTYLAARGLPAAKLAGATVFTTGDPAAIAPALAEAVASAPAPVGRDWVLCDAGVRAPCASAMHRRGCLRPVATTHHEVQGRIDVLVVQQGTRPYFVPGPSEHEGAIVRDAGGRVVPQGTEALCVGLSIPKAPAPPGGWPLVIYGHGTGGDYQSGLEQLAGPLSNIAGIAGGRAAVLTFDNVMHGPRQGLPEAAWVDPGDVFFNLQNPRAARDNILQGATDVLSLVRFARTATLTVAGVGAVRFDPARITYYGHSQGTVIMPPALAVDEGLRGVVLTGAGAELGLTVLEKKQPTDISALVRTAFGDQSLSRLHPAIALLSTFYGASDAPAYAQRLSTPSRGFLLVYGLRDGFTPEATQAALVRGGRLPLVGPVLRPIAGATTVPSMPPPSVGAVQFAPPTSGVTYDGHFVGSRDAEARRVIEQFLGTALTGARAEIRR